MAGGIIFIVADLALLTYQILICMRKDGPTVTKMIIALFTLLMILAIVQLCFVFYVRFSNDGRLCSGDFLPDDYEDWKDFNQFKDYLLIHEGQFLKACMWILLTVPLMIACFVWYSKQGQEYNDGQKNKLDFLKGEAG